MNGHGGGSLSVKSCTCEKKPQTVKSSKCTPSCAFSIGPDWSPCRADSGPRALSLFSPGSSASGNDKNLGHEVKTWMFVHICLTFIEEIIPWRLFSAVLFVRLQIWVHSGHNASGYFTVYGDEALQSDHFNSRLSFGDTQTVWARTGYLGFLRRTELTDASGGQGGPFVEHGRRG